MVLNNTWYTGMDNKSDFDDRNRDMQRPEIAAAQAKGIGLLKDSTPSFVRTVVSECIRIVCGTRRTAEFDREDRWKSTLTDRVMKMVSSDCNGSDINSRAD
ncbi:uncharacterized protein LOC111249155 [Varroa destructor]|uniref:Uncharacterized protein n=1 Tax=Varroa destructor TaxID=109461 RepID=A0A7M7JZR1_VARDE|nr:uncharacterized protein LOC111249155 [Varroa destructor]